MLLSIEGLGWAELLRWDAGGTALAGRLLRGLGMAAAMFLLCRATGNVTLAPFGMALLAAALMAGRSAAAPLIGCMAAALRGGLAEFDLRLPVGAALVLGGSLAWDLAAPALGRWRNGPAGGRLRQLAARLQPDRAGRPTPRQARSPNRRAAALAGFGTLIPALVGRTGPLWTAGVTGLAASVAAVAAAPFMAEALAAEPARRAIGPEARGGMLLTAGLLVAGLTRCSGPLGLWAAAALALLMYPNGALAGVGFGGMLLAAGAEPTLFAAVALGGATARLCTDMTRPARAVGVSGAMLTAGVLLNAPSSALVALGAAGLSVAALPEAWTERAAGLARPLPRSDDPRRLALRLRRDSARRLRALGAAFGELAEGYRAPARLPDEQQLMLRLRERLCSGCGGYARCWDGGGEGGARLLCDLIARAVAQSGEAPLFEGEAPPELCRRCRRGRLIPERLQEPLEDFARARLTELRRGAENRLVSRQFDQARRLLEGLACRQERPPGSRRGERLRVSAGVLCASREAGAPCGDSHLVCRLEGCRLLALICDGMGSGDGAARESAVAVRLLGRFLRAGAPGSLAVETVNALMLNRGGEEMFATVDMLVIDLVTGAALFTKLAACCTLIAREGEVLRVEGGRLPLGILEQVRPERSRLDLRPGDVVLMASDGVMDAAGPGALEALLLDDPTDMPALARRVLDAAGRAGGHRDDMTAVCLRVDDKR